MAWPADDRSTSGATTLHLAKLRRDFRQRRNPRAVNPIVVRHQNAHMAEACKHAASCGPDLELSGGVNVWILCNEDAGRGLWRTT